MKPWQRQDYICGLPDLGPGDKALLFVLSRHADDRSLSCFLGWSALKAASGIRSNDGIEAAIRRLEARGLISVMRPPKHSGCRKSNEYRLLFASAECSAGRSINTPISQPEYSDSEYSNTPLGGDQPLNRIEPATTRLRASHSQDSPREKIWTLGVTILTSSGRTESAARALLGKWIRDHGEEAVAGALGAAATRADPAAYLGGILRRGHRKANGAELLLTPEEERAARGRPQ